MSADAPVDAPSPPTDLHRRYGRLVHRIAQRVAGPRGRSRDIEDLVADGMVGLLEAARRFDPERSVAFSTFAFHRIRGAVQDGLRRLEPIGAATVRSEAGVASALDDDVDVETLADEARPRPDEVAATRQAAESLEAGLAVLFPAERRLIEARYRDDLSLEAAAARLGLSKSWASRLHARAIDKLGRLLEDRGHARPASSPTRSPAARRPRTGA